ncbi:MAG: YcxB family protein [Candidatus Choladocola sp.]|nr:YcxB family protein [Candidatus Choladocola sp.]
METKFDIQMSTGAMYGFMMYHGYHEFSGIFSIIAAIGLFVLYFVRVGSGAENIWIYPLFGVLFLVYQPFSFYTRSAKQVKLNPVFKKPLMYELSDKGIHVTQGDASTVIPWDQVCKVRETAKSIYVYTSARNAHIWVKDQMGDRTETVKKILLFYVDKKKVRLKEK